uniref:Family with sequence similarity 241 member A n=1 Tax=Kryptolebias marmoratus TaxID=37003 RepID=A0A3Q3AGJ8_KRYMA
MSLPASRGRALTVLVDSCNGRLSGRTLPAVLSGHFAWESRKLVPDNQPEHVRCTAACRRTLGGRPAAGQWARPRPHSHDRQQQQVDDDGGTAEEPELDDCKRMGTLFGMINKCLLGLGFSQMSFGDRTVEPVVILIFWLLLWFLGFQALGLVGTLCLIIIYIQK